MCNTLFLQEEEEEEEEEKIRNAGL
jgi:hypothetical protein